MEGVWIVLWRWCPQGQLLCFRVLCFQCFGRGIFGGGACSVLGLEGHGILEEALAVFWRGTCSVLEGRGIFGGGACSVLEGRGIFGGRLQCIGGV